MSFGTPEASLYIGVPLFFILVVGLYFLMQRLAKVQMRDKPKRWHAFQLPWDQWQVLAMGWVIYGAFVFWVVAMPALTTTEDEKAFLYWLHGILFGIVVVLWIYLSFANPSREATADNLGPQYYCDKCATYWNGRRRKHCRHCHKCIVDYDHHCFFLNTCVSNWNYKPFFVILTTFNLVNIVEFSATIGALSGFHAGDHEAVEHARLIVGDIPFCVFGYSLLLAGMPAGLGAAALLGLHCYLCGKGITTFQWLGSRYEEDRIQRRILKEQEAMQAAGLSIVASSPTLPDRPAAVAGVGAAAVAAEPDTPSNKRTRRHWFVRNCLPCIAQTDEVGLPKHMAKEQGGSPMGAEVHQGPEGGLAEAPTSSTAYGVRRVPPPAASPRSPVLRQSQEQASQEENESLATASEEAEGDVESVAEGDMSVAEEPKPEPTADEEAVMVEMSDVEEAAADEAAATSS